MGAPSSAGSDQRPPAPPPTDVGFARTDQKGLKEVGGGAGAWTELKNTPLLHTPVCTHSWATLQYTPVRAHSHSHTLPGGPGCSSISPTHVVVVQDLGGIVSLKLSDLSTRTPTKAVVCLNLPGNGWMKGQPAAHPPPPGHPDSSRLQEGSTVGGQQPRLP